jgi:hypothetical protein
MILPFVDLLFYFIFVFSLFFIFELFIRPEVAVFHVLTIFSSTYKHNTCLLLSEA